MIWTISALFLIKALNAVAVAASLSAIAIFGEALTRPRTRTR